MGVVFVSEGLEEISECGIEATGLTAGLSGIRDAQVGDALAHGQEGCVHRVSPDRVVGGSKASVADPEDEEVVETLLLVDSAEGRGDTDFFAELGPPAEVRVLRLAVLGSSGSAGALMSSAEVSEEAVLGSRVKSTQGLACG